MDRSSRIFFTALTALAINLASDQRAGAQDVQVSGAVTDLGQSGTDVKVQGAYPVDSSKWPASFYATIPAGVNNLGRTLILRCTSTLVSSRSLITAAHCVPDNGRISIRVDGDIFGGTCLHSDKYVTDDSADYAFCLLDKEVDAPSVLFERINLDRERVKLGDQLTLTGFGCTDIVDGEAVGGNDGVYRAGLVKVTALPAQPGNEKNTILTVGADNPNTALCMGDSGGPAFLVNDVTGERWFVSVNSRVRNTTKESFLSSTGSDDGRDFFLEQFKLNGLKVCGDSNEAVRCRQ